MKKGDPLLELFSTDLAAAKIEYKTAQGDLMRDQDKLRWSQDMFDKGNPVAGLKFNAARNAETRSRLKLQLAKDKLLNVLGLDDEAIGRIEKESDEARARMTLRSPVDGIVIEVDAKPGNLHNTKSVLAVIEAAIAREAGRALIGDPRGRGRGSSSYASTEEPPLLISLLVALTYAGSGPRPSPLADIGPAPRTVLVDSAGKTFDLASRRGKVVLVSFVYTTCTGVCPATTQAIVRIQNVLKEAKLWGTSVEFVSITLDPKRDTPEVLREYARLFHADPAAWHFLTGPPGQVQSVIADWGMWAKAGPTGALDHPSRVFLLDPRGHQREIYNLEFLKPEVVLEDVRGLLKGCSAHPLREPLYRPRN